MKLCVNYYARQHFKNSSIHAAESESGDSLRTPKRRLGARRVFEHAVDFDGRGIDEARACGEWTPIETCLASSTDRPDQLTIQ